MSFLNELRILLIDARIALRDVPGVEDEPLWARLEQAIRRISEEVMPPPAPSTKTTAQQVALAWQTASRGLKHSHPALYDELASKVMVLLDERELVEPVTELLQLEAQVKQLEASRKAFETRMAELGRKAGEAQQRLEQLYQALAGAAPPVPPGADAQATALQQLEALRAHGGGSGSGGGRKGRGAAAPVASESPIPTRVVLDAVAAGTRPFTREQREWSVAECLALTGWQFTPIELIERGDPWLAQQLLAAPNAPH
jgi:hypothetical protein